MFFEPVAGVARPGHPPPRQELRRAAFTADRDTGQTKAVAPQSFVRHMVDEVHADL